MCIMQLNVFCRNFYGRFHLIFPNVTKSLVFNFIYLQNKNPIGRKQYEYRKYERPITIITFLPTKHYIEIRRVGIGTNIGGH